LRRRSPSDTRTFLVLESVLAWGRCRILHLNFREFTLAELRWIEYRPYNAWRLPEGLRSNPGAEDDAENQG
jgi:hypothetical protein